ncbi:MAG: beta-galactosidase [Patescibacteria group bacterium]
MRRKLSQKTKKILKHGTLWVLFVVLLVLLMMWSTPMAQTKVIGTTFSVEQSYYLGLNPHEVLESIFHDLGIRDIRLSVYWNRTERERGVLNFEEVDWQLALAERYGARVILAVGRKVPRWPECHDPGWYRALSEEERREEQLALVRAVIERYKSHPSIVMWEVENEPYLPYGDCPDYAVELLDEEIALVRALDSHPILVTDSGELSFWVMAARRGDIFGTTMYRTVYNRFFGQITYPIPPEFFRIKQTFTRWAVGKKPLIVIELQGEPWAARPYHTLPVEEQYETMSPQMFRETMEYSARAGFDTIYIWGVEWWFWLKVNGHNEIWDIVREKIQQVSAESIIQ